MCERSSLNLPVQDRRIYYLYVFKVLYASSKFIIKITVIVWPEDIENILHYYIFVKKSKLYIA